MLDIIWIGFLLWMLCSVVVMFIVVTDGDLLMDLDPIHTILGWPLILILIIIRAYRHIFKTFKKYGGK